MQPTLQMNMPPMSFNPNFNFGTAVTQINGIRLVGLAKSVTDEVLLKIFMRESL